MKFSRFIRLGSFTSLFLILSIHACLAQLDEDEYGVYENPEFAQLTKSHKMIAILPFQTDVKLKKSELENGVNEQFYTNLEKRGDAMQESLFYFYVTLLDKGKVNENVRVMMPHQTNKTLSDHGIGYMDIVDYTAGDLCTLLKVDGVIHGEIQLDRAPAGLPTQNSDIMPDFIIGQSGRMDMRLTGESGELLWQYKAAHLKFSDDSKTFIYRLMKKASRKWPYE